MTRSFQKYLCFAYAIRSAFGHSIPNVHRRLGVTHRVIPAYTAVHSHNTGPSKGVGVNCEFGKIGTGPVADIPIHLGWCTTKDRYLKIQREVNHALSVTDLSLREWQSLLGLLQSVADQVPLGRLHIRPLITILASQCPLTSHSETRVPFSNQFIPP